MSGDAARVDAAFDVMFNRPCVCPERHAASGACQQKAAIATGADGMCRPCASCHDASALAWAPALHEVFDLARAPVEWPQGRLRAPRGAQAGR